MRVLLSIVFLLPGLLFAQGGNTVVGVDLDTAVIRIGEQVRLRMQVSYAKSTAPTIEWPNIGDTLNQHLEVVQDSGIDTVIAELQMARQERTLIITSFDTGFWAVPAFRFLVNGKPLESAALLIEVRSAQIDSALVLRDIKDIITLPFSPWYWVKQHAFWVGVVVGFITVIAAIIFFIIQWRRRPRTEAPVADIALHEKILQAMDALDKERIWQQGDHKGYHSRLTDLLRGYIEERYRLPALESTTDELIRELRVSALSVDQRGQLENMLRTADMVKFAKSLPSPQENEQMMIGSVRFVRETARHVEPIAHAEA